MDGLLRKIVAVLLMLNSFSLAAGDMYSVLKESMHRKGERSGIPLQVTLFPGINAGSDGVVQFEISNTGNQDMIIPIWKLPSKTIEDDKFAVYFNDQAIEYEGPIVKREPDSEKDYVALHAGEVRRIDADIADVYDMTRNGEYRIRYQNFMQGIKLYDGRSFVDFGALLPVLESPN
jgi:hypothetical protein